MINKTFYHLSKWEGQKFSTINTPTFARGRFIIKVVAPYYPYICPILFLTDTIQLYDLLNFSSESLRQKLGFWRQNEEKTCCDQKTRIPKKFELGGSLPRMHEESCSQYWGIRRRWMPGVLGSPRRRRLVGCVQLRRLRLPPEFPQKGSCV